MASNPIVEWWVELGGGERDLNDAAQSFRMNDTCRVDIDKDGKHYLKSRLFNPLTDGNDVLDRAEELVLRINGALKIQFSDFQPIHHTRNLVKLGADGSRGTVVVIEAAKLTVSGGRVSAITSGGMESEPSPSDAEKWLELSVDNDHVADTLMYVSREPNWFDLYKLFEVIRSATGGQSEMYARLSEGEEDRIALKEKCRHFTATANAVHDIRHARPNSIPPGNPMTLREADRLLKNLANRYLKSQTNQDTPP